MFTIVIPMKNPVKTIVLISVVALVSGSLIASRLILSGSVKNIENRTVITFYGWGNASEVALTRQFVDSYNESQDKIFVQYTSIPSSDYQTKITNSLYSRTPPDVLLAGDGEIKPWIEVNGLAELDDYLKDSSIDLDDFWEEGQNRYYYNIQRRMNGNYKDPQYKAQGYHHYGIMRDLSPTVLFYNKTAFEKVGIKVISLNEKDCLEKYGVARGFFQVDDQYYFNDQIAMTWDETLAISRMNTLNTAADASNRNPKAVTTYGIHYVNWFSLGWSCNSNSLQWVRDDTYSLGGRYVFTLDDPRPNYSVKEGKTITLGSGVRETTYTEGQLIRFDNLDDAAALTTAEKEEYLYTLPSSLQAMQDYVDLSATYKVAPRPDFMNSSSVSQYSVFTSGNQTAMIVDSRYAVGIYRQLIKNNFEWNCAPLPHYEHGVASGHSGSLAYCISNKSTHKKEAFEFIEYINGLEGQSAFAEAGFTIPNTKTLSNSNVFLQKKKDPTNSIMFVDAASYQTVGDWGFLPSKDWISPWANLLNTKVLNGDMTLIDACNASRDTTQKIIDDYYKGINRKV